MGDINSTYVKPRATDIPAAMGPVTPEATEEDDAALQDQIALKRAKALEDQLEARPLKRKQEELEKQDLETEEKTAQESSDGATPEESKETVPAEDSNITATNGASEIPPHHRQALLRNDDQELDRVDKVRFGTYVDLSLIRLRSYFVRYTQGSLMHCRGPEVVSEYHLLPSRVPACYSMSG
jgi:hypothetical protein